MEKRRYKLKPNSFIIIIACFALIILGNKIFAGDDYYFTAENNLTSQKAEAIEILDYNYNEGTALLFSCKLLNGQDKGKTIEAVQFVDSYLGESIRQVQAGDTIYLGDAASYNIGVDWFLYEYERFHGVAWLGLAFAVLLLIFGRKKGFKTIVSIVFTVLTIFMVFIPAVLSGYNVYMCSLALCIYITLMSLLIVQGINAKCFAAILGCLGGLFVISIITVFMSSLLKITGLVSEDSVYLIQLNTATPIDLKAVVFASITIGAMGAVLDIAVDIVAALSEINRHKIHMSLSKALKSGIIIGQDIVGSMSNTLILAYIGSSLSLILLVLVNTGSSTELLNSELIIVEILQALAGSIGILFTIPLTALSYGILNNLDTKEKTDEILLP
ncbi:MAG: YibE/F family protein [Clostridia bacterium]|nr:YibE/F family protein [Clostridia bacterium]